MVELRKRWVYAYARGLGGKEMEQKGWNDEKGDDDCVEGGGGHASRQRS